MSLKILGSANDIRTQTPVIYAQIPISEYLFLVGTEFDSFEIQRKREKYKAYDRLKKDVMEGALLPSITLAVKPEIVPSILPTTQDQDTSKLASLLSNPNQVYILDGLQRTYILSDLAKENFQFGKNQTLLLEFWLEQELKHLIYRIIVLNAGRKPMSMRHQVELLFLVIKQTIERMIPDLEIYQERDMSRRRGPKKYTLDRIAMSYQCFLLRSHEPQRESVVAQELAENEVLDSTEDVLDEQFKLFVDYLRIYSKIDYAACQIYMHEDDTRGIPTGVQWFASDTTLFSFFAALADFGTTEIRRKRILTSLNTMLNELGRAEPGGDPLGFQTLDKLVKGINARKYNIGTATRRLYFTAFKEYFREEGEKSLVECWLSATE